MRVCKKCRSVEENGKCMVCGTPKYLYIPSETDNVLLAKVDYVWSEAFSEILTDNNISYVRKADYSEVEDYFGPLVDEYKFYVTYCDYDDAKALLEEFNNASKITDEEYDMIINSQFDNKEIMEDEQ